MARIESPLIGSGSQEEVDLRVQALLDLGTSRGYLTYEELNERLPDEVVSPDKLDSLLMMIDEMGIKLIDETDIAEHQQKVVAGSKSKSRKGQHQGRKADQAGQDRQARQGRRGSRPRKKTMMKRSI